MSDTWDLEAVKHRIMKHEGYRDTVYNDHLGNATIGYGHLITPSDKFVKGKRYSTAELKKVFEYDFNIAKKDMELVLADCGDQPNVVKEIIIEMCFQMGRPRVMKFRKMLEAIKNKTYKIASTEMLDSVWARQTSNRAHNLAELMRSI